MKPLVFRVDASTAMGTGHVMRCLALAQAWQEEGGRTVFIIGGEAEVLTPRLTAEGVGIERIGAPPGGEEDIRRTAACAKSLGADWVVVDGYHFSGRYQRLLRETGFRLLALDDYGHAEHYEADLVLNQNLSANESLYRNRAVHTRLLLGTRFVLLRREFIKWRGWRREIPEVAHKVLVTLGGSDPDNATLKVIQALQGLRLKGLEVVILVGVANPHRGVLEVAVREAPSFRLFVNSTDMPELITWADVAVSAGGTTSWELSFLGLPAVLLILAENQERSTGLLARRGGVVSVGWWNAATVEDITSTVKDLLLSPSKRMALRDSGMKLVDGKGVSRIIRLLVKEGSV